MGLTTALYTSLSGMIANSEAITVSGNNIANVNTTGFKSSRASFETQISQFISGGTAPTADSGGTNPTQVGLGVRVGSVTRDFSNGALQATGVNTDLAIEGSGFFILNLDGTQLYTRAGTFALDRDSKLVNPDGGQVQGFSVDANFQVVDGVLDDLVIPIGSLTLAEATGTVQFAGNLNAGGDAATVGANINSGALFSDAAATTPAIAADALTTLFDTDGNQLFNPSDVLTLTGARKGGLILPDSTFEIGAANTTASDANGDTVQSLLDFFEAVLGIDNTVPGATAGVTVSGAGEIVIEGNTGTSNDLEVETGNLILNQGATPELPLDFSKQNDADGESVRTTFFAFDSLGNPMTLDLTVVLEQKTNTGTIWRFYVQSEDDSDLARAMSTGTLDFDTNGELIAVTDNAFTIDRDGSGAFAPQQMTLEFENPDGTVSALTSTNSQLAVVVQDGSPMGTLEDFSVATDGRVIGIFSNSLLRDLGQIGVAQFANPQGMEAVGDNLFRPSANTGSIAVVAPGEGGSGRIVGGALELSNVDLTQQFINLITASNGFAASSRVLSTSDRLIQELLAIMR